MRTAIYGAGSLGTVLGAYIAKSGGQADLINRNKAHTAALRWAGAHVCGTAEFTVPVTALLPEEMTGRYDLILLMTKQQHNAEVVASLHPFLADDGVLCTVQNGLPEPAIAEIIGAERVVGCTVAWGATMTGPGVVRLTSNPEHMTMSVGTISPEADGKLERVRSVLSQMCPTEIDSNFMGARWSKLLINAAFSGLSAVFGCTFGEVAGNRKTRMLAQQVIKECIDVARAAGIRIQPMQGKDIARLMDYNNAFKRRIAFAMIPLAIRKHRLIRASMLQDLENGRPTEVDAINGVVCEFGRRYGVPTPVGDKIIEIIHGIERGAYRPGAENLKLF